MKKITVDGNTAAATIAYAFSEVATIYPITPSSTMAELCDSWASEGRKNLFGNKLKVVEMQSEGGASGALHGSLSAGALTTTFTASQGLLLMIPNMYKIAGELTPCVMHVSARALATHALSIFGDHSDVMSVRQTGWAMLCSSSVQECMDLALVAHLATLKSSVPFVHFFDGFRTSHEINTIEEIDLEKITPLVPFDKIAEFKQRALNSATPHQQGTAQNPDIYFQNREASNKYYNLTPEIVKSVMKEVGNITGRHYNLFDYVGDPNAENIIVIMGSGATTTEETVKYLNKNFNAKLGVVKVRLFRPFSSIDFIKSLPKTLKNIAVLDRTKESGSDGEPLYKDVITALFNHGYKDVKVIGGRYGLGSKEFTPSMVNAVFENLQSTTPKTNFTIGINDDVTNLSLDINKIIHPSDDSVTACKFYGFGGDGTVSANKSSIKIIGNNTNLNGQAYFEYDSKKSGNATICHLRFGENQINESYLLDNIDFIACHNQTYVTKYNLLKDLKDNGTFLLNTGWDLADLERMLPNRMKKELALKNIKFYTIDAYDIANKIGLGNKINLVMQSAFFKLINIIPFELAVKEMKDFAKKSYGKKGDAILNKNYEAIESANSKIIEIKYPESWKNIPDEKIETSTKDTNYYNSFIKPISRLEGNDLPVSSFNERGFVPTGTSQYEKRGIASSLPTWIPENCIQCNMCSFVCPHAAIRPVLVDENNIKDLPDNVKLLDATAEKGKKFAIQCSSKDCTGCGLCANICPALKKALVMQPSEDIMEVENKKFEYLNSLPKENSKIFKPTTVKGSQFNKPYFEFSGACAGCGETPYIKVLTQLFGDKMIIANATGCSSIYGGSSPTCPYTKDENGYGVAWANSLFEDNAEFGYGINIASNLNYENLRNNLQTISNLCNNEELSNTIQEYFNLTDSKEQRLYGIKINAKLETIKTDNSELQKAINETKLLGNHYAKQSIWVIGGDGWAYDIGYGGLDHLIASGENINILVLDTEVYSNTGGQSSKSTPAGAVAKFASDGKKTNKKDLALMATTYKNVYVAKVALGADMNQFVKAITEAEAYNGVSLIIAYAPCINHGINMSNSIEEEKRAVQSGYWHLFRYNPDLREQGKKPFILDSKPPVIDYEDFILSENRYKILKQTNEEKAKKLFEIAKKNSEETYNIYKTLSELL